MEVHAVVFFLKKNCKFPPQTIVDTESGFGKENEKMVLLMN